MRRDVRPVRPLGTPVARGLLVVARKNATQVKAAEHVRLGVTAA